LESDSHNSMKKSIGFLLLSAVLGIFSCKNDIDLAGEYKDTPIVYCLLNPAEGTHYIRIQKAFLINGNILETAKIPDSLKYDPSDLEVKIQAINPATGQPPAFPDSLHNPIIFQYQTGSVQDTGIFATDGLMIYKADKRLDDKLTYHLSITNTKLGKEVTAETPLVRGFTFKNPNAGVMNFNSPSGTGYTLRWGAATNGFVYQPEIIMRWTEVVLATGVSRADSVVWTITTKESTAAEASTPGTEMDFNLAQNSFYRFVGDNVAPNPNVKRVIGNLRFKFYVGTEELNTYINVNKPSIGLIQEKPAYTNITNGLGIFSGRSVFIKDMSFAEPAKDTLIVGTYTKDLNFRRN